jgi:hypothetical protein
MRNIVAVIVGSFQLISEAGYTFFVFFSSHLKVLSSEMDPAEIRLIR